MQQNIIYEELLQCNKVGHETKLIESLCIYPQCKQQRTCCSTCKFNDHSSHNDYVKTLSDIKAQYRSQVQPFQLVGQLRERIEIQLSRIPIYPIEVNLSNLNAFANQLIYLRGDHVNEIKDSLIQSTQIIESTLNRVLNSIKQEDKISLEKRKAEAEKLRDQGYALRQQGKNEDAIILYNQSIAIYDQDHVCWCNKGVALDDLQKYEQAIECYDQAIQIKSDKPIYYSNKATSLSNLYRFDEALVQAEKAIQLDPKNASSWNAKGNALAGLNRNQEALKSYKKAVEIQPDHIRLRNLADTLEQLGQKKEALKYYKQSLEYVPNYQYSLDGLKRLKQEGIE